MKRLRLRQISDDQIVKAVNFLLLLTSACIYYASVELITRNFETSSKDQYIKNEVQIIVPTKQEQRRYFPILFNARNDFEKVIIPGTKMQTEYLGSYFITAYCPEECGGSWSTSSGATCHYHDEWYEPTTCAIDRSVHGYNELILVGNPDDPDRKVYITEDTGPGVRGYWVDCFVVSMSEVRAWNSSWRPVYSVSFETENTIKSKKRYLYESFRNYLFMRCDGSGADLWNDYRADD